MIEINLLPKEYRKRATPFHFNKKWIYAGAAVVFVFLLLAGLTIYKKHSITSLDEKIASVKKQRLALSKDIKLIDDLTDLKQKLLTRMTAIENLDKNRGMWVSIMEDLSNRVPELLWLTKLVEQKPEQPKPTKRRPRGRTQQEAEADSVQVAEPTKKQAYIEGYAYTLNSIASFLVNVMKSDYFLDVELAYAKQENVKDIAAYNFRINCVVDYEAWLRYDYQPEKSFSSPLAEQ